MSHLALSHSRSALQVQRTWYKDATKVLRQLETNTGSNRDTALASFITFTAPHTPQTATASVSEHVPRLRNQSGRQVWPCNSCDLIFEASQEQRDHMKGPWQSVCPAHTQVLADLA